MREQIRLMMKPGFMPVSWQTSLKDSNFDCDKAVIRVATALGHGRVPRARYHVGARSDLSPLFGGRRDPASTLYETRQSRIVHLGAVTGRPSRVP